MYSERNFPYYLAVAVSHHKGASLQATTVVTTYKAEIQAEDVDFPVKATVIEVIQS